MRCCKVGEERWARHGLPHSSYVDCLVCHCCLGLLYFDVAVAVSCGWLFWCGWCCRDVVDAPPLPTSPFGISRSVPPSDAGSVLSVPSSTAPSDIHIAVGASSTDIIANSDQHRGSFATSETKLIKSSPDDASMHKKAVWMLATMVFGFMGGTLMVPAYLASHVDGVDGVHYMLSFGIGVGINTVVLLAIVAYRSADGFFHGNAKAVVLMQRRDVVVTARRYTSSRACIVNKRAWFSNGCRPALPRCRPAWASVGNAVEHRQPCASTALHIFLAPVVLPPSLFFLASSLWEVERDDSKP